MVKNRAPYFCELCGEEHRYVEAPPDKRYDERTKPERERLLKHLNYGDHRRYERSTGIAASIRHLREMLKPGDVVHTILRHSARSGMMRHISLVVVMKDTGAVHDITGYAADALDMRRAADGGIKAGGCGMDMGFHLAYSLSRMLFRNFDCIGENCPSNDHCNGDRNRKPHHHSDGGYALNHRWM
jgi:hypothetical protein